MDQFKNGLLFSMTPARYEPAPAGDVKSEIVKVVGLKPKTRPQIYELIIPKYFLQRRKKDYRAMIDDLVFKEGRLYANPRTLKTTNRLNDETLLSTRPWTVSRA